MASQWEIRESIERPGLMGGTCRSIGTAVARVHLS